MLCLHGIALSPCALPARLRMLRARERKPSALIVTSRPPGPAPATRNADEAELRQLGESLEERQNEPAQAKLDGTIIDGWRLLRW